MSTSYKLRKRLGYTQKEFGKLLKKTGRTVARWEKAGEMPIEHVLSICDRFGFDPSQYSKVIRDAKKTRLILEPHGKFPLYLKYPNHPIQKALICLILSTGIVTAGPCEGIGKDKHPLGRSRVVTLDFEVSPLFTAVELKDFIQSNSQILDKIYQHTFYYWDGENYRIEMSQRAHANVLRFSKNLNCANEELSARRIVFNLDDFIFPGLFDGYHNLEEYARQIFAKQDFDYQFSDDLDSYGKIYRVLRKMQSDLVGEAVIVERREKNGA